MRKEINWAKPILVGGTRVQFKLATTCNEYQLVVVTDGPQASQTLYKVFKDGSSLIIQEGLERPVIGPWFSNEPEVVTVAPCFINIYKDGSTGFRHTSIEAAVKNRPTGTNIIAASSIWVGTAEVNITVDENGKVSGSVTGKL